MQSRSTAKPPTRKVASDGKNFNKENLVDQIDRFEEAARKLGCDEDEAVFDERLKEMARQRPQPERVTDETPMNETTLRLEKTGTGACGWIIDYRNPPSGAPWRLTHPQSEMHGGAPRLLTRTI